jgi:hypothetical protein
MSERWWERGGEGGWGKRGMGKGKRGEGGGSDARIGRGTTCERVLMVVAVIHRRRWSVV